jgi:hypothetical protein
MRNLVPYFDGKTPVTEVLWRQRLPFSNFMSLMKKFEQEVRLRIAFCCE